MDYSSFFISFIGLVDDPDPFQQPAPLKLCYQLAEDVKWFKVLLLLKLGFYYLLSIRLIQKIFS